MTSPLAQTAAGAVSGRDVDGVAAFLGIPYADAVSGAGRFLPPRTPQGWTGVRRADSLGPVAPQLTRPGRPAQPDVSEDCLVANVWTPGTSGSRPVLFWIHGGGFFTGSSYAPYTDGAALARNEDVVVVSVNHRLALLGFLHLEELGGREWGFEANSSILDLIAALEWVRENIGAFGGDPERVTIFGHSGGGGKVSTLLAAPSARGLFHRAVVHGGPPFGLKDAGRATLIADQALRLLDLGSADLAKLQAVPLERLLEVQTTLGVGEVPTENGMLFAPVVGTGSVPAFPEEALASGVASGVPLMTGTALDEARYMLAGAPHWRDPAFDVDDATLVRLVAAGMDDAGEAEQLVGGYRERGASGGDRNVDLAMDVLSDQFAVRTARLADAFVGGGGRVHSYLCDLNHSGPMGAFHGIEMPTFFANVGLGTIGMKGPSYDRASALTSHALASFARDGVPDVPEIGWPSYEPGRRTQLRFGDDGFELTDRFVAERAGWWHGVTTSGRRDPWGRASAECTRTRP